ncbi:condensation domain-containing protein, partial [Streptomyces sp. NPDC059755]|uniref:condensation domain-containing protein n=1 Tax=Streptomyces sp. NPDC059755 TaxID=3346934 RepID=UPI00364EEFDC
MVANDAVYNAPLRLRLSGVVDVGVLGAALADVVGRHEILRTVYPEVDGEPMQQVVPVEDMRFGLSVVEADASTIEDVVSRASGEPFDLKRDLPVRAWLVASAPEEYVLLLVVHHIASDGWSSTPLLRDLSVAYEARLAGRAPVWEPLPVQYADYTLWQR